MDTEPSRDLDEDTRANRSREHIELEEKFEYEHEVEDEEAEVKIERSRLAQLGHYWTMRTCKEARIESLSELYVIIVLMACKGG